jgi:hypothetical protein
VRQGRLSGSVGCDEKVGDPSFVPLAIDTDRREPTSAVNDRIVIEMNGNGVEASGADPSTPDIYANCGIGLAILDSLRPPTMRVQVE